MATEMRFVMSTKENALVFMTFLLIPCFVLGFMGMSRMRAASEQFETNPDMPQVKDLLYAFSFSFCIIFLRYYSTKMLKPVSRLILSPEKRTNEERVDRFATVAFKFSFFLCITVTGFFVMQDEPWFPRVLGGKGDVVKAFQVLHLAPSFAFKMYYLLQLGYHLHSLFYMIAFSPLRNDFLEMFLHHVATILLIMCSFLSNYMAIGALIVFTHDIGDVTGYLIKSAVDTEKTNMVVVLYLLLLSSWGYTRLYVYPMHLIYTVTIIPSMNLDISNLFLSSCTAMLCMLQVLHVYWYVLFLVMGYNLVSKGIQEDIQHKVEDKNKSQKKFK